MSPQIVIVGASMGGLRTAEQLRAQGFEGDITVVGDEVHRPYNRPPLSKEALSGHGSEVTTEELLESVAFRQKASTEDVTWALGSPAVSADLTVRQVVLGDGTVIPFDALVVASGLRPRRLVQESPSNGRHAVRTIDDAVALRREVQPGVRAVVVGGGFIGCETASTLKDLGAHVTVVEPLPVPMVRGVGEDLGAALRDHHSQAGVDFITGQGVRELRGDDEGRVTAVVLDDGTELPAELVIESIGSHTNVEWLDGNGLDLSDGVLCDNHMRVEGRPNVVAVGDVARFPNHRFDGVPRRVEHWNIPTETAKRAAKTLADYFADEPQASEAFMPLPAFWSDQFGLRLQSFGSPGLADQCVVEQGSLDDLESGVVMTYLLDGRVVGTVLVNIPASQHRHYRDASAPLSEHV